MASELYSVSDSHFCFGVYVVNGRIQFPVMEKGAELTLRPFLDGMGLDVLQKSAHAMGWTLQKVDFQEHLQYEPVASQSQPASARNLGTMKLEVVLADITQLGGVDAIVNAANTSLMGGGGVDGAIHRAAGPRLLAHCARLGGCLVGEAKITPGYDLPAKWIIHTVGPVWGAANPACIKLSERVNEYGPGRDDALLESCYFQSLKVAANSGLRSIAFPAISTGVYGFPRERAARLVVQTVRIWALVERVVFCCYSKRDLDLYEAVLKES